MTLALMLISTIAVSAEAESKSLSLSNGITLRYVTMGSGPPLVLLHTMRTNADYFQRITPMLAPHYRLYVVDLPGHGESTGPASAKYDAAVMHQSVQELIERLQLSEVTLAGESIGGTLALTIGAAMPERVTRVVAINPYDFGDRFGGGIRNSSGGWIIGFFRFFHTHTPEPKFLLARVLRGGFVHPTNLPPDLIEELYRNGRKPGARRAEYSVFANWKSWIAARERYADSNTVTLVYSDHDWSREADRRRDRDAFPSATHRTIEGAGHFASLEKPEAVARIILEK